MSEDKPEPQEEQSEEESVDVEKCRYDECERLSELGSYHCLFHMSEEEKEEQGLWKECMRLFYELVDAKEGNFRRFVLKDVDLSGKVLSQEVDFSFCIFLGSFKCSGTKFKKAVKFECSEFTGRTSFRDGFFGSEANFYGARFGVSEGTRSVDFMSSFFNKEANFDGAVFHDTPEFICAKFNRDALFNGAIFHNAHFGSSYFEKKAYFKGTKFKLGNFNNVTFGDRCTFSQDTLSGSEDRKTFFSVAHFDRTYFEKGGSFDDSTIEEGSFENASIQNVSFHRVNLDKVKFAGAQMEQAYLADAWWDVPAERSTWKKFSDLISVSDPRYVIREEDEVKKIPEDKREVQIQALLKAESTYRRLKFTHTNEGDYTKSGEFYIHEMRMKRERYSLEKKTELRAWWKLFWNWFYNVSCGYGERPKRVVANALLVIVVFAMIYYLGEGITKGGEEDYEPNLREGLYFSVVTFTTLGYGDYSPKVDFQLLATLEAFTGAFTIALFVLVFGRQVMR